MNFIRGFVMSLVAGVIIALVAVVFHVEPRQDTVLLVSVAYGLGYIVSWIKAQADE